MFMNFTSECCNGVYIVINEKDKCVGENVEKKLKCDKKLSIAVNILSKHV